ncbi:MAG TPA: hypothetical protein VNT22_09895 [Baekduia sp.]|nr:hypothetical protein [Baekduia sp.]
MTTVAPAKPFMWSPRARRVVLTAHIVISVGLLGDLAGFLGVAILGTTTSDPAVAEGCWHVLQLFAFAFGIPLSFGSLVTGIALGVGTKWGVLRYPWVTAKLAIVISVILVGAFILGPAVEEMLTGDGGTEWKLIAGSGYDILAMITATTLSVFKPGRARRGRALRTQSA